MKVYPMFNLDTLTIAELDRLIDAAIDAMQPDNIARHLDSDAHESAIAFAVIFDKELNQ